MNLFLGEVIFGGVGSGLYGMFFYILIAVFVAGLMVGRTPEWLGKKIEAREIKFAALGALFVPTMVLVLTAISITTNVGLASIFNSGSTASLRPCTPTTPRGKTTAARSQASAPPLSAEIRHDRDDPRPIRAGPGRARPRRPLAGKKIVPESAGTFRTDGATFVVLLVGVIALTAGLMIFPRSRWARSSRG